ncbi:hypothetical protein JW905_18230, partial [bacterium]|nr:hypothetical protein [candidate division CSSED10-310 bacterium]
MDVDSSAGSSDLDKLLAEASELMASRDFDAACRNLRSALRHDGCHEEGRRLFQSCLQSMATEQVEELLTKEAYFAHERGDLERAVFFWEELLKRRPDHEASRRSLMSARERLEQRREAAELTVTLRQALRQRRLDQAQRLLQRLRDVRAEAPDYDELGAAVALLETAAVRLARAVDEARMAMTTG